MLFARMRKAEPALTPGSGTVRSVVVGASPILPNTAGGRGETCMPRRGACQALFFTAPLNSGCRPVTTSSVTMNLLAGGCSGNS